MRLSAIILSLIMCIEALWADSAIQILGVDTPHEHMTFICEDQIWEYIKTLHPNSDFSVLYYMKFDGEAEVNGQVYNRFVNFKALEYRNGLTGESVQLPEQDCLPSSYYREAGDTVYILMNGDEPATGIIDDSADYSEAVMMDFSLSEGDVFPMDLYRRYEDIDNLYVHYIDSEREESNMPGKYFELYSLEEDSSKTVYKPIFGEGIGLTTGILPEIDLYWNTGTMDSFLLSVRQGEEFLYKDSRYDLFWGNSSVESIDDSLPNIECRNNMVYARGETITVYDLSGKTVVEGRSEVSTAGLQPGVYVARTGGKSLKIIVRE